MSVTRRQAYFEQDVGESADHRQSTGLLLRLQLDENLTKKRHWYVKNDDALPSRLAEKRLRRRRRIKKLLIDICTHRGTEESRGNVRKNTQTFRKVPSRESHRWFLHDIFGNNYAFFTKTGK